MDPQSVLTYVRNNPGRSGEQIASEAGTDTATLRPVLRELIAAGAVTASGKGPGDAVRGGVGPVRWVVPARSAL